MKPNVSVIVPNYNNSKYLSACLDSVASQSHKSFECLVIDDCSKDDSEKIIKAYVKRDKRFRFIKMPKNSGVGAVRNFGMDKARGEYLFFLDSDDAMAPAALENLLRVAESIGADLVSGKFQKVPENFRPPALAVGGLNFSFEYFEKPHQVGDFLCGIDLVVVWGKLYRAELLKKMRFRADIYPYEDVEFMMRLYPKVKIAAASAALALYYRQSDNSVINDKNRDISGDVIKVGSSLVDFMATCPDGLSVDYILLLKEYCYEFLRRYILRTINLINSSEISTSYRKQLKLQLLDVAEFIVAARRVGLFRDIKMKLRERIGVTLFSMGFVMIGAAMLKRNGGG
ncbi:MAG: glycosyltransferase [Alphaproteobacteria bacterium]|nr:glycosyltransferase [Alphaproteobacteria bacterium]